MRRLIFMLLVLTPLVPAEGAADGNRQQAPRRRAHRRPRAAPIAFVYRGPALRLGLAALVNPPPERPHLALAPSYYEFHAGRVQRDFLSFQSALPGQNPVIDRPLAMIGDKRRKLSFVAPPATDDPLRQLRENDRLALLREVPPAATAVAITVGLSLFMTAVVGAAHAPSALRFLFDGPVHLGPAVFESGGMARALARFFHDESAEVAANPSQAGGAPWRISFSTQSKWPSGMKPATAATRSAVRPSTGPQRRRA